MKFETIVLKQGKKWLILYIHVVLNITIHLCNISTIFCFSYSNRTYHIHTHFTAINNSTAKKNLFFFIRILFNNINLNTRTLKKCFTLLKFLFYFNLPSEETYSQFFSEIKSPPPPKPSIQKTSPPLMNRFYLQLINRLKVWFVTLCTTMYYVQRTHFREAHYSVKIPVIGFFKF